MEKLVDILVYFCRFYPYKKELSKARLTKLVYLVDWKSAIERGCQMSNIKWVFNHYGPYVSDVVTTAENSSLFKLVEEYNSFGYPKTVINLVDQNYKINLNSKEIKIIEHVIRHTKDYYWDGFIDLIYSTYPVVSSDRYDVLDLVEKANKYKTIKI